MKEKVRPIYSELQGYLARAPEEGGSYNESFWNQVNTAIEELNQATAKDYNKFKLTPKLTRITPNDPGSLRISFDIYRANLGGLIARLHGEYFSDEPPPFQNMPSTVINQTQNQSQSVSLLLDMQERILSEMSKYPAGSKERTFLEKMKDKLPSLRDAAGLLSSVLQIGSDIGLNAAEIHKILHL